MTTASTVRRPPPAFAPFGFEAVDASGKDRIFVGTGPDGLPVGPDWGETPHLLFLGAAGSGKSVGMEGVLYGSLVKGYRGVVINTAGRGDDFRFADGYVEAFATTTLDALTALRNVYSETRHPSPDRPPVVVVIDDLRSIVAQNPIPRAETEDRHPSPELSALVTANQVRSEMAVLVNHLVRIGRSGGVHLVAATHRLCDLENMGLPILKANASSFRLGGYPIGYPDAPEADAYRLRLGDIPKGRGLWEPPLSPPVPVQFWYASQAELRANLASRIHPVL